MKQKWKLMAWMWIVADVFFLMVGLQHQLAGLILLSLVFIYHGILRLNDVEQTGIFTFQKRQTGCSPA